MDTNPKEQILKAVANYADAYRKLQDLQDSHPKVIPKGDQKTGAIGEFYAMLFVKALHPNAKIEFGGISNKAWDISIDENSKTTLIQVKTTSAFAKHKRLSPIHHGFDELFVIHLNKNMMPDGFWIIHDNSFIKPNEILKACSAPKITQEKKISKPLVFGKNQIATLCAVLDIPFPHEVAPVI